MHLIDPLVQKRRQPRTSRRPDTSNNLPLYCGVGIPRPPTPLIRSDLRLSNDSSIIRLSSQIYSSPSLVELIYLPTIIGDSVSRSLNPSACLNLTEPRHPTSRNPHPMYASSALLFTPHQPRRQPFSAILPLDRVIIPQMTKLLTPHSGLAHLMPKYNYPYNGPRVLHDVSPSINPRPNRESGRLCAHSGTRKPQKKEIIFHGGPLPRPKRRYLPLGPALPIANSENNGTFHRRRWSPVQLPPYVFLPLPTNHCSEQQHHPSTRHLVSQLYPPLRTTLRQTPTTNRMNPYPTHRPD